MVREDLTDRQEQQLDDFLYTFNRGVLTPIRRRLGSKNVINDISEDFILSWSNNWRDVKNMMKWISDQPTLSYVLTKESPIAQQQFTLAQERRNEYNLAMLERIENTTPYKEEFRDVVGSVEEARRRYRQQNDDLTKEKDKYYKTKYRESMKYGEEESRRREDRTHLKAWRDILNDTIPHLAQIDPEVYNFFMKKATPEQVATMISQDPYVTIDYMYEAQFHPIFDPDSQEIMQVKNIVESLRKWYLLFSEEEEYE